MFWAGSQIYAHCLRYIQGIATSRIQFISVTGSSSPDSSFSVSSVINFLHLDPAIPIKTQLSACVCVSDLGAGSVRSERQVPARASFHHHLSDRVAGRKRAQPGSDRILAVAGRFLLFPREWQALPDPVSVGVQLRDAGMVS